MLFPVIKIKKGDKVHIVGTNSHDELIIHNNAIHYLNLQGMVGTRYPDESGMYFVGKEPDEFEVYASVEMVSIEELIKIAEENMVMQTDASLRLHESLKRYVATRAECEEKRSRDDVTDTTGMLF